MDTVSPASPPAAIPAAIGTLSRVRRPPTRQTEMKYIYDHCDRDGRAGPARARMRPSVRRGPKRAAAESVPTGRRHDQVPTPAERWGAEPRENCPLCVRARIGTPGRTLERDALVHSKFSIFVVNK